MACSSDSPGALPHSLQSFFDGVFRSVHALPSMEPPETKYTKLGESYIAYQVIGEGPIDHIYVTGIGSHVDVQWEFPPIHRFVERMTSFSRLIYFDRRGTGASDPVPLDALPTWEDWTEDARAVLDAVGSE